MLKTRERKIKEERENNLRMFESVRERERVKRERIETEKLYIKKKT